MAKKPTLFQNIEHSPNITPLKAMEYVATPEPSPTRSASPNRNPGTLSLFLFIFRVIKFSFSKMSRPESPA